MKLSISYWLHEQFQHHPEFATTAIPPLNPAIARAALDECTAGLAEGIIWCGYYGFRLRKDFFRPLFRADFKADPRHFERFGQAITWELYDDRTEEINAYLSRHRAKILTQLNVLPNQEVEK